ncbi:hypothetical protein [Pseudoteredinibacter isoporae]|uniref:hypothetical protein n=1 Tax=Pseudoteredinibacter isoporae TaxID=570281 RepID=UPI003104771F
MSQVFILQNQDGYFLSKQKEWVDGRDASLLYRSPHRDEALNQMVEVNAKDYTQRITIVDCQLNDKRHPALDPEKLPEPKVDVASDNESTLSDDTEGTSEEAHSSIAETDVTEAEATSPNQPSTHNLF